MAKTVTSDESDEDKQKKVKKFKIVKASRLGSKAEHKTQPVRVQYENTDAVNTLLSNRKNLPVGVYVDREHSMETTKNRRTLRPYFNAAKKSPEYFTKCKLEGDVLVLKGTRYTVNNLHELPDNLNGFHASSRSDTDTFAFFGELNLLSNFHTSHFNLDGVNYQNSEQYIQSEKARYFKDERTASNILRATSGFECKRLSREIKNYKHDEWKHVAREVCQPGITAKYEQNPQLMDLLFSIGEKLIVEATRDPVWGTGVQLTNPNVLDHNKWHGNGILSDILMEIRAHHRELRNERYESNMDVETINNQQKAANPSNTP